MVTEPPDAEPNETWPTTIYVLPNGGVISRRELTSDIGNTKLAHRSQLVLRIHPQREPGDSDGGQEFTVECLKFRGDVSAFFRSVAESFMKDPEAEKALFRAMFNQDPPTKEK